MQKLPLGIQSFEEIRVKNYLYIDKTPQVEQLVNDSAKYVFLSRPRRFGKSLLLNTLKHLFMGDKHLFDGLYIQSRWDWTQTNPVILLDFNLITTLGTPEDLKTALIRRLDAIAREYDLILSDNFYTTRFEELIIALKQKTGRQVVILVDEYDMPLTSNLTDVPKAEAMRDVLREFYRMLKSLDQYLHFVFITGVSRFSKISIFSGLNNVDDITMKPKFNGIVGWTTQDIETNFKPYIAEAMAELALNQEELLRGIKDWYNGYSWDGKNLVYNPLSVLMFFDLKQFSNFWYQTATPKFLLDLIKKQKMSPIVLEDIHMSENELRDFDFSHIALPTLLLQTGYLTVKKTLQMGNSGIGYELTYPNHEVRLSLIQNIWSMMDIYRQNSAIIEAYDMRVALELGKTDQFLTILRQIFGRLPFKLRIGQEKYYQSLFYMLVTMMGLKPDLERLTSVGIIDTVLECSDKIYIIEFKYADPKTGITLDKLTESAITQIKDRHYYESYLAENKEILLLGVGFLGKKEIDMKIKPLRDL